MHDRSRARIGNRLVTIAGATRNAVAEGVATKSDLEAGFARLEARMYVGFLATIGVVVALVKLIP